MDKAEQGYDLFSDGIELVFKMYFIKEINISSQLFQLIILDCFG